MVEVSYSRGVQLLMDPWTWSCCNQFEESNQTLGGNLVEAAGHLGVWEPHTLKVTVGHLEEPPHIEGGCWPPGRAPHIEGGCWSPGRALHIEGGCWPPGRVPHIEGGCWPPARAPHIEGGCWPPVWAPHIEGGCWPPGRVRHIEGGYWPHGRAPTHWSSLLIDTITFFDINLV